LDCGGFFPLAAHHSSRQAQGHEKLKVNWQSRQNTDGGWAYSRGCSWTEPTAIVLLAQTAAGREQESFTSGIRFLRSLETRDGGWRPQSDVAEGTWVTSLVGLLPEQAIGVQRHQRAIQWLKGHTGRESGWYYKIQQRLNGNPLYGNTNKEVFAEGWPWFPGAAAWVIPTTFAILAFERELAIRHDSGVDPELAERVALGKKYLLSHMCADGGWNYGANRALGRDGDSYPETTGIALLGLRGVKIDRSIAAAKKHLASCLTAEGISWLRMGLAAHGESISVFVEPACRTTMDAALWALASAPVNPLL
jgi:hypothetical protein